MIESFLKILAGYGPVGIISAVFLYLHLRERVTNVEMLNKLVNLLISDTASKVKMADALEDLNEMITSLEVDSRSEHIGCRSTVDTMISTVKNYLEEIRVDRAREEGRREATDPRFKIPGV
jgi:hypothetical protein